MLRINRASVLCLIFFVSLIISCSPDQNNSEIIDEENETEVSSEDENKVYPEGVAFETQEKLSEFLEKGYTEINGSLSFIGTEIDDVSECTQLKKIDGPLSVVGTNLENLNGLNNIELIDNSQATIQIRNNPKLNNIEALSSVAHKLRDLDITNNPNLSSLKGTENITEVRGNLSIRDNEQLTNLDALHNIQGEVNYVYLINSGIENTHGLSKLERIKEKLVISNNPNLTSISFQNLNEVPGFIVNENSSLLEIIAQPNFTEAEALIITHNTLLEDISGFENVEGYEYFGIEIGKNAKLDNFCPLIKIANVAEYDFNIKDNLYNPSKEKIKTGDCQLTE
jgi:hypothetical protein